MKNTYCSNCGKAGHNYKNCKNPIISYGIMLFRYDIDIFKLLLVQRKDSISYIEFTFWLYHNRYKCNLKLIFNQ